MSNTEFWDRLEDECKIAHRCQDWELRYALGRKDKRAERRIREEQRKVKSVRNAIEKVYTDEPDLKPEEAMSSILAILLPFVIPFLRQWLISRFEKLIIDWFFSKISSLPDKEWAAGPLKFEIAGDEATV